MYPSKSSFLAFQMTLWSRLRYNQLMIKLPEDLEDIHKRNRAQKLSPKKHKIAHEFGRSAKSLWLKINERKIKK